MPIYEYQCQACGKLHEALQKISDEPLRDCPDCGKPQLRKKVSAAGFRLKGGGWYETDFKSGNRKNVAGAPEGKDGQTGDKTGGDGKDSSTSGSGESKAAEKTASEKKTGDNKTGASGDRSKPA